MKFCDACGNILVVKNSGGNNFLLCRTCNKQYPLDENMKIEDTNKSESEEISVIGDNENTEFPITKVLCPQCEKETEAFWAMQQTRASDEPPTRFYRCRECNHVWREYS